jgi:hypothetical protein
MRMAMSNHPTLICEDNSHRLRFASVLLDIKPLPNTIHFLRKSLDQYIVGVRKALPFHMLEFAVIAFDFTMI